MFTNRMRYFAKHVINPVMIRTAGSPRSSFAIMRHVGRRSGKSYETPIIVHPMGEQFVIAQTFGSQVDWYRNLRAVGQATLFWHGKAYTIQQPASLDHIQARAIFSPLERFILRLLGVEQFISVKSTVKEE